MYDMYGQSCEEIGVRVECSGSFHVIRERRVWPRATIDFQGCIYKQERKVSTESQKATGFLGLREEMRADS
jgi:hypothetical protein